MKALSFGGNGLEYFKIWIVNILLTILTFGLYYPWAKVRRNRYFYGNTSLQERDFEYHATGKQLFFGYLIALVLFVIYIVFSEIFPILGTLLAIVMFGFIPWVIVKSMMFNMRMSSFSNVRFGFDGDFSGSYFIFLVLPLLLNLGFGISVAIAFGLFGLHPIIGVVGLLGCLAYAVFAFAYFVKRSSEFYLKNTNFGGGSFETTFNLKELMAISLKILGFGLLLTLIIFGILFAATYSIIDLATLQNSLEGLQTEEEMNIMPLLIGMFTLYAGLILVWVATMAFSFVLNREYIYDNTILDNEIRFSSSLKALPYVWVVFSNFLLIIFTLGLGAPWAKVRVAKMVVENTYVDAPHGFDRYITQKQAKSSALGEQIGDAFDVDVGLGM
jgi:uncharacterized membrane protein YjgN (DUF898 family)